jgi:hypothetical protein
MFKPLDMLREIREDHQLTTAQVAILMCAVLRTGDRRDPAKQNQVCADRAQLAEDAKVSLSTAKRVYRSKEFRKYFDITYEPRRGREWLILRWRGPGGHAGGHAGGHHDPPPAYLLPDESSREKELVEKINSFLLETED